MATQDTTADINIHLRARAEDRDLIDQAAALAGTNRSQFMMASSLKEAKNVLLDQTTVFVDSRKFEKIMAWIDGEAVAGEEAGLKRLLNTKRR